MVWAALCMPAWIQRAVFSWVLSSWYCGRWTPCVPTIRLPALVSKAAVFEARGTARGGHHLAFGGACTPCCPGPPGVDRQVCWASRLGRALPRVLPERVPMRCGRQATGVGRGAEAGSFRSFEACRVVGRCGRVPHFPCWFFLMVFGDMVWSDAGAYAALERHLDVSKLPWGQNPRCWVEGRVGVEQYGHDEASGVWTFFHCRRGS